jgi:hypothetical protein
MKRIHIGEIMFVCLCPYSFFEVSELTQMRLAIGGIKQNAV